MHELHAGAELTKAADVPGSDDGISVGRDLFRKPTTQHQTKINHIYRQIFPGQRMGSKALKSIT